MSEIMEQYYKDHPIVECDKKCGALHDPKTPEEIKAAWKHWKNHPYMSGCSHGC